MDVSYSLAFAALVMASLALSGASLWSCQTLLGIPALAAPVAWSKWSRQLAGHAGVRDAAQFHVPLEISSLAR